MNKIIIRGFHPFVNHVFPGFRSPGSGAAHRAEHAGGDKGCAAVQMQIPDHIALTVENAGKAGVRQGGTVTEEAAHIADGHITGDTVHVNVTGEHRVQALLPMIYLPGKPHQVAGVGDMIHAACLTGGLTAAAQQAKAVGVKIRVGTGVAVEVDQTVDAGEIQLGQGIAGYIQLLQLGEDLNALLLRTNGLPYLRCIAPGSEKSV